MNATIEMFWKDRALHADRVIAEISAERDFLRRAIKKLAAQKLTSEMDDDEREASDFVGAYDYIVSDARSYLASQGSAEARPGETEQEERV